jgi:hypothetical protein
MHFAFYVDFDLYLDLICATAHLTKKTVIFLLFLCSSFPVLPLPQGVATHSLGTAGLSRLQIEGETFRMRKKQHEARLLVHPSA